MARNGTEWKPSAKQVKVAQLLVNPDDRRSKQKKLESVGVPSRTFYNWMSDSRFLKYLSDQVDLYTDGELPEVWKSLINQCTRGDTSAIKLYFEMKGKYKQTIEHSGEIDTGSKELASILRQLRGDDDTKQDQANASSDSG